MTHRQPTVSRTPARSRLARWVMALAMLAQLVGVVALPASHWRQSSTLGAHFEQPGSRQHYVHDENQCVACATQHVTAAVPRRVPAPPALVLRQRVPLVAVIVAPLTERRTAAPPRAPPPSRVFG